jgi:hypothetical protein
MLQRTGKESGGLSYALQTYERADVSSTDIPLCYPLTYEVPVKNSEKYEERSKSNSQTLHTFNLFRKRH